MKLVWALCLLVASACAVTPATLSWYFHDWLNAGNDSSLSHEEFGQFLMNTDKRTTKEEVARLSERIDYVISRFDRDASGSIEWNEYVAQVGEPIEAGIQQVHLSVGVDYSKMVVMWVTRDQSESVVEYGTSSQQYTMSANGTMTTYNVGVFGWAGWIHTVELDNLNPLTQYYYKCGSQSYYWSPEYSFRTAPSTPSPQLQYSFAVLGDMGTHIPMGYAVAEQMVRDNKLEPFDLILHAGDIAYAGTGGTWEFEEVWDVWEDQVEAIASQVPYMFAVGNHEHYYNYTAYRTRFKMPTFNLKFWYSINYGNVHFVFISTEHDYDRGSEQYQWLQKDLEEATLNRNEVPWIIMIGHRPMYCSDIPEYSEHSPGGHFQVEIEPLMLKYQVDLYLAGHMHMYERTWPVMNGTVVAKGNSFVNPQAPIHVTQGTGGVFTDSDRDWVYPDPSWSASRDSHWGYARLTVNNMTLTYTFMSEWYNKAEDQFTITKTI